MDHSSLHNKRLDLINKLDVETKEKNSIVNRLNKASRESGINNTTLNQISAALKHSWKFILRVDYYKIMLGSTVDADNVNTELIELKKRKEECINKKIDLEKEIKELTDKKKDLIKKMELLVNEIIKVKEEINKIAITNNEMSDVLICKDTTIPGIINIIVKHTFKASENSTNIMTVEKEYYYKDNKWYSVSNYAQNHKQVTKLKETMLNKYRDDFTSNP